MAAMEAEQDDPFADIGDAPADEPEEDEARTSGGADSSIGGAHIESVAKEGDSTPVSKTLHRFFSPSKV